MSSTNRLTPQLLEAARRGDPRAAEEILPLIYQELRRLARARMSKLPPGNTLQPTALVHEAYLRVLRGKGEDDWNSRGHFFGAAAEAMRQILVEQARRKASIKGGGNLKRVDESEMELPLASPTEDVLALHHALERLETDDPRKASIIKLRYFAGLKREEVAEVLGVSLRTIDREWRYILARLHRDISVDSQGPERRES